MCVGIRLPPTHQHLHHHQQQQHNTISVRHLCVSPYRHTFKVRVHSELSDYTAGIKKGGTFDITVAASEAEAAVVVVGRNWVSFGKR